MSSKRNLPKVLILLSSSIPINKIIIQLLQNQGSLTSWLVKDPEPNEEINIENNDEPIVEKDSDELLDESLSDAPTQKDDIGFYIGIKCSDEEKYWLLKNRWIPKENYKFPASTNRNLRFQRNWLLGFPWLSYSVKFDGAFCQFCFLFSQSEGGKGKHVALKSFVTEPFKDWKHAKEQFRSHQKCEYHNNCVISAQHFMDVHEKKIIDIRSQLNTSRLVEVERNRKVLASIIETIIFLGRQDIAFRGHRDSGNISADVPLQNDGNFRSLIRFRMATGDDILRKHMQSSSFTWTSPRVQNELIELCGDLILDKLIEKIHKAEIFSILADGTTDISGTEQFSICARYIEKVEDGEIIREDFLKFVPIVDASGEGLSITIKNSCQNMMLNLTNCRGQGYDGASSMSGIFQGCATKISREYPQAPYVHCASHSFNLAVKFLRCLSNFYHKEYTWHNE